jgi:hypothetical protein
MSIEIEELLGCCLLPSTRHTEKGGLTVFIENQRGESTLFFQPDSEEFRTRFYGPPSPNSAKGERVTCDLLCLYRNAGHPSIMSFVELKRGMDFEHGLKQLERVITVLAPHIENVPEAPKRVAMYVSDRAVQYFRQDLIEVFFKTLKIRLHFVRAERPDLSAGFMPVDLRKELRTIDHLRPLVAEPSVPESDRQRAQEKRGAPPSRVALTK